MKKYDLRERTFNFSITLVKFLNRLSSSRLSNPIFNQLIRSGTSIGANIEESDSSPSRKDFKYKIVIAKKEAAETVYWLKILIEGGILKNEQNINKAKEILNEAKELVKILSSILRKLNSNVPSQSEGHNVRTF
jgi:four helix bundle protein